MAGKLEEYTRKRNLEKSGEPAGGAEASGEGPRFVVQHHLARREHYDLRLEWDGVLLSWAVPKGPSYYTRDKRLAVQVEDHPLEYRNFEGTIPKGEYGGGVVMLWDEGFWEPQGDVEEGLRAGALKFALNGKRLRGKWTLVRLKAREGEKKTNWLFLKEKDEYAKEEAGIAGFTTSVRTGRTMAEIEKGEEEKLAKNPFRTADVQLAKLVHTIPEGEDWLYELKYDGYRILAFLEGNQVRLVSRNGKDYTRRFREAAFSLVDWAGGRAMVLDGEMVITNAEGKTDFQALQSYLRNPKGSLSYIVFDLLALDGADLRGRSLIERKETLEALMENAPPNLHYSRHLRGKGEESFQAACRANMEGIVGKRADSIYSGTRNGDWIKLKCDTRQEFVIGGYLLSDQEGGIRSLLLGFFKDGEFYYAGRAGTGLSGRSRKELEAKLKRLKRKESPFRQTPKIKKDEKVIWLEPELVAEIKFAGWTGKNLLRQASFKGFRVDKEPGEVQMEQAEKKTKADEKAKEEPPSEERPGRVMSGGSMIIGGIRITNPDKVIFQSPEISKADVVRYYEAVSERMLPYVRNRILSIVRCPKGISQSCFYKKHPGPKSEGIVTIPVRTGGGELEEYFYLESVSGLLSEAQMGTLEFHTWASRADNLEKPDLMVFDLDPDEGMEPGTVRQGVRDLKSILDSLALKSYLKTSGGKGYHVVVPIQPSAGWDAFYGFAKGVAEVMEQKWPDRYTANVRKSRRANKIFIDWMRNGRGATSIAPYSIRARKGARVSMPIAWRELDTVAPDGIDMEGALRRLGENPWIDFFELNQRLKG